MKWILIFLLTFVPSAVGAEEKKFLDSWKRYDEVLLSSDDGGVLFRKKMTLPFTSLSAYSGEMARPPDMRAEIENTYLLWSQGDTALLIVTPRNIMKDMTLLNEEYKQRLKQCREEKSWLVVLPENRWIEIELNPYCTMHYGEEQILINLYWADSSRRPFVDIVTNALTCVPHYLYGWDRKSRSYILKSSKCSGIRPFESYSGGLDPSRQVYPPLSQRY